MKKILVPTDFSAYAKKALSDTLQITKRKKVEIILLHCVATNLDWSGIPPEKQEKYTETYTATKNAHKMLQDMLKNKMFKNYKTKAIVTHGIPSKQIVKIANKENVDLIVMGSHGVNESNEYFIGSTIQKTLRGANCPVMFIKKNHKNKNWKKMVFAANFDDDIKKEFSNILKLARSIGSSVHLLFVNTPENFKTTAEALKLMQNFKEQFKNAKMTIGIYNHPQIYRGIIAYCHTIKADFVALAANNRRKTPNYLVGNTETLIYQSDIPVLNLTQQ